ncbi:MAG: phosphate regulon sensor histidine kinase PhoR [Alphaproteobacteria bacterium]|nr:phosphate regulon sensor histidine kinase PhoR [Alphaproteobacteria bacterium]
MWRRVSARLKRQRWSVVAMVLVLAWLAASLPVEPLDLVIGLVLFVLALALAPDSVEALHRGPDAAEVAARSFEETLFRVGETVGLPWVIVDERGTVRQVNALAARQFAKLELGVPVSLSLRNPVLVSAIDNCRRTGASQTVEMQQAVPTLMFFRVHVAPLAPLLADMPTTHKWMVITFADVTEQRRIDAMRADFIANASHELRTPLTSVIGFIETLRGPAARDAKAREKFLGIMATQSGRMSRLIDDLLSLSRIESRQHLTPSGTVDLRGLLDEVSESLAPQAAEAGVTISCHLPPSAVVISGDRTELHEVFENLMENALKYGGDGGSIEVSLKPAATGSGYAYAITVTDHGPGIPAEHVPRLTERFYRVDAESSRKKKGTGLGLAIVKHIVNRHRGLMTIRSELGKGTSVEVLLPA